MINGKYLRLKSVSDDILKSLIDLYITCCEPIIIFENNELKFEYRWVDDQAKETADVLNGMLNNILKQQFEELKKEAHNE